MWLRKRTQNLPTSFTNCRLNPHDQLGGLSVYTTHERAMGIIAKEKNKEKSGKRTENSLRDIRNDIEHTNIQIIEEKNSLRKILMRL